MGSHRLKRIQYTQVGYAFQRDVFGVEVFFHALAATFLAKARFFAAAERRVRGRWHPVVVSPVVRRAAGWRARDDAGMLRPATGCHSRPGCSTVAVKGREGGCLRPRRAGKTSLFAGVSSVGLPGLEPGTSSLSEKRSNHLSYRPGVIDATDARRSNNVQHAHVADNPIAGVGGGK